MLVRQVPSQEKAVRLHWAYLLDSNKRQSITLTTFFSDLKLWIKKQW
ncbi:hypothetical protein T458_26125 [Brevibacillus panacihumi W25]|uniref:Transposase n=1 Tax=Brevibacillus panacihumi W25 TaxID=1408254 RepID=V6M0J6_9BACL|nr:hypothetical protein T458_26125 [Brevibacillus panacihumi W25]